MIRTRKQKVTTIARQTIAEQSAENGTAIISSTSRRTYWTVTATRMREIRSGLVTLPISGRVKAGCIWRSTIALGPMADKVSLLDLHSRRVIGWAVSNRMKRDLSTRALKMAIAYRALAKGCIHHADRGSQYCSHDYQNILRQHGFKISMSGKGNCYDNDAVKTFFKTIKAELIWRDSWKTRRKAETAIFEYINGFYNPRRRHSALGWKSPVAFERKVA